MIGDDFYLNSPITNHHCPSFPDLAAPLRHKPGGQRWMARFGHD